MHILQVGSSPARPSLTLQDILGRPVSLFLSAQGKPLRFQEQIWLVWGWVFFGSAVSFSTSDLAWKNAAIPKIKVF